MRARRRKGILLLAILVLLVAAAWITSRPRGDAMHDPATRSVDAGRVDADASPSPAPRAATPPPANAAPPAPALPALDAAPPPPADAATVADRGQDALAACRLAARATRCMHAQRMMRNEHRDEATVRELSVGNHSEAEVERRIDVALDRQRIIETALAGCTDLDVTEANIAGYRIRAAAAGDTASQIEYLRGHHLNGAALLRDASALDDYRRDASAYFTHVLAVGDVRVLDLWATTVEYPDGMALSTFLPAAWREPGFVAALARQLTEAQRDAAFMPGQFARATAVASTPTQDAAAADFYARHFAGKPLPPSRAPRRPPSATQDPNAWLRGIFEQPEDGCMASE